MENLRREGEPLLPKLSSHLPNNNKDGFNKSKWLIAPGLLATLYVGNITWSSATKNQDPLVEEFLQTSTSMTISVDSGYGQPNSVSRGFYSEIEAIVEPHRVTTFTVSSSASFDSKATFKWSVIEETKKNNKDEVFDSVAFSKQEDKTVYYSPSFSLKPKFEMHKALKLESTAAIAHHNFGAVAAKRILISVECLETGEKSSMLVHGKYVRREVRALSDDDRELYLAAMHKVYTTDTKTGIAIYGESYLGYDYFAYHHLGPAQVNHPWHGTPVFFTSHAVLSAQFENSMQMIEPSVSMCYWDFVQDSLIYSDESQFKNGWGDSSIWSSKWFGPMAFSEDGLFETTEISNTEKRLSGRWAETPMCLSASSDLGPNDKTGFQYNSYGWSRDVNNNNPATSATRSFEICGLKTTSMGLPGCFELLGALNSKDISECHFATECALHSDLHPKIGGAWECGYNFRSLAHRMKDLGSEYEEVVNQNVMNLYKLWRVAYFYDELSRPEHCQLSTPFEECQLHCSDFESDLEASDEGVTGYNGNWYGIEPTAETLDSDKWDAYFRSKVVISKDQPAVKLEIDIDEDTGRYYFTAIDKSEHKIQDELKASLVISTCRPGKIGEFMGPLGGAQDPMFFPVHSQFERIWQYMRIVKGMSSEWPDVDDVISSDVDFTPLGWNYDDPVEPFTDVLGVKRSPIGTVYTNREIAALVNPVRSQFLPFVYEYVTFDICTGGDDEA